jgi:hypothetical protein
MMFHETYSYVQYELVEILWKYYCIDYFDEHHNRRQVYEYA